MKTRPSWNGGFTLVELLTVIAIIAILVGLLLPALMRAKVQARVAQASTELNELASAIRLYNTEYGTWPTKEAGFKMDSNLVSILRGDVSTNNPRGIKFFNFDSKRLKNGEFVDPFYKADGKDYVYKVAFDDDYDGQTIIPAGTPPFAAAAGAITQSMGVVLWMNTNSSVPLTNQIARTWK